jgi:hypothetical protein
MANLIYAGSSIAIPDGLKTDELAKALKTIANEGNTCGLNSTSKALTQKRSASSSDPESPLASSAINSTGTQ